MRIRNKAWAADEVSCNALIMADFNKKGEWSSVFNNNNPLRLEIGCGKGSFICEMAKRHPNVNFVALERETKIIAVAARRARLEGVGGIEGIEVIEGVENIRFINADAELLPDIFDQGELERIYINFCDPWPGKKKWGKRRLTYRAFLDNYRSLLEENGAVYFKTDNRELFDFSINEFTQRSWRLEQVTYDLHQESYAPDIAKTEYEIKFLNREQPIHRLIARP